VAGVDYPVGIPSGTTLTPIASASIPGASLSGNLLRCKTPGSTITINAVEFGDKTIYDNTSCSWNVSNSHFGCPANYTSIAADNLTIANDEFNQAGCTSPSSFVTGDNVVLRYNWFRNGSAHVLETGGGGGGRIVEQFNLIDTMVPGGAATGAHENWLQLSGTSAVNDPLISYNTAYQPRAGNGEGWQFYCNSGPCQVNNPTLANNTVVTLPGAGMSYLVNGGDASHPTFPVSNGINRDNYFDPRGAYGAHYPGTMTSARGWTSSGNMDINTGRPITAG